MRIIINRYYDAEIEEILINKNNYNLYNIVITTSNVNRIMSALKDEEFVLITLEGEILIDAKKYAIDKMQDLVIIYGGDKDVNL